MEIIKQLVFQRFTSERFGRKRQYALGKLLVRLILKKSSRTRIKAKCGRFKISYPRILNWETKETVTREDLPYIISDVWTVKRTKKNSSGVLCIITLKVCVLPQLFV
jgi:hypothetical protein